MRRAAFVVILLFVALVAPGPLQAGGKKANAVDLIRRMNLAAGFVCKAVKEAKLEVAQKQNQPFLAALIKVCKGIDDLEQAATAKNETYWNSLHRVAGAIQAIEAAIRSLPGKTPNLAGGVKKLCESFELYRRQYGKQAARKKKGGDLSDQEKAAFAGLLEQNKKLLAEFEKLKALAAKNAALLAEIAELIKLAGAVMSAPRTVEAYCDVLYWIEDCEGTWEYCLDYVIHEAPDLIGDFENSHRVVGATETVYWSSLNAVIYEAADWASLEVEVEVSVDLEIEIGATEADEYEAYVEAADVEVEEYTFEEDNDDDNDGIPDATDDDDDNDGIKDDKDLDDDGDGELDCADSDADQDGVPDDEDLDDDNDGTPDAVDDDDDNDGIKDGEDEDDDNDGVADEDEGDLDGDGTPDTMDDDDDNDGTPDAVDDDDDNDGTPDAADEDDDNDGTPDAEEADDDGGGDGGDGDAGGE